MQRIVVLNPKGGSGKTTIAITLAAYFAQRGDQPVLMDHDPQGSATRWVRKRQAHQPPIHLIAAFENSSRTTRSFQLRVPDSAGRVIVDTAAAVEAQQMPEFTRTADKILVPVLPSDIDIHACTRCISNLLLVAKIKRADNRLGIIANRVKRNTLMYQSLLRFLETLDIPIVGTLRESQNYIRSAELGLGLHEMKSYQVAEDEAQWQSILEWLASPSRVPQQTSAPGPVVLPPSLASMAAQAPAAARAPMSVPLNATVNVSTKQAGTASSLASPIPKAATPAPVNGLSTAVPAPNPAPPAPGPTTTVKAPPPGAKPNLNPGFLRIR